MDKTQPLKKRLIEIMKNNWLFPDDIDASALADEIKEALASTDSMLRDRLASTGFYHLVKSGRLSDEKCRSLLFDIISEKYMLKNLGMEYDDSVFGRGFYAYAAEEFISYNRAVNGRLLSDDEVRKVFAVMLKCFKEEKDLRDLDDVKGWAHTAAHIGDVLGSFAEDGAIGHDELVETLYAIKEKICVDYHCYRSDEWGRLADVVIKILERGVVNEKEFFDWTASFMKYGKTGNILTDGRLLHNRYHFFLNLNRMLEKNYPNLRPCVWEAIIELMES